MGRRSKQAIWMVLLLRAEGGEKEPRVGLMAPDDGRQTAAEAMILPLTPEEALVVDVARSLDSGTMIEQAHSIITEVQNLVGFSNKIPSHFARSLACLVPRVSELASLLRSLIKHSPPPLRSLIKLSPPPTPPPATSKIQINREDHCFGFRRATIFRRHQAELGLLLAAIDAQQRHPPKHFSFAIPRSRRS